MRVRRKSVLFSKWEIEKTIWKRRVAASFSAWRFHSPRVSKGPRCVKRKTSQRVFQISGPSSYSCSDDNPKKETNEKHDKNSKKQEKTHRSRKLRIRPYPQTSTHALLIVRYSSVDIENIPHATWARAGEMSTVVCGLAGNEVDIFVWGWVAPNQGKGNERENRGDDISDWLHFESRLDLMDCVCVFDMRVESWGLIRWQLDMELILLKESGGIWIMDGWYLWGTGGGIYFVNHHGSLYCFHGVAKCLVW